MGLILPKGFRQVGNVRKNVTHTVKKKISKANEINSPPDSIQAKMIVKLVFLGLAIASVMFFIVSGFEIAPSAIVRSIKDKKVLQQAEGAGYPVEIDGNRSLDIYPMSNSVAVLTDTNCMLLDDKGREAVSKAHYMAAPLMKTAERYILLYDKGSLRYSLNTLADTVLSGKTDNTILSGDLAKNGRFVLVTGHDTSFSQVVVYSKSGSTLHKWKSSSCYVFDAAINPSGNYIALCGVYSEGGILKSSIIIQKVGGKENYAEFKYDNMLPLSIKFIDNEHVIVFGDNTTSVISIKSKKQKDYSYNGWTLNAFDVSPNGSIALVLSEYGDGQNCSVVVLNKDLKKQAEIKTELSAPKLELTNNRVNLISLSNFYSYNYSGSLVKESKVSADCQECMTYDGKTLLRSNSIIDVLE